MLTAATIEDSSVAIRTPVAPAITAVTRLTNSNFLSETWGFRNVLYRSTAREVDSMNSIASVALSSAEKMEASAQMPIHLGNNFIMTVGRASSGLLKCGYAASAHKPRMAGTMA